MKLPEEAKKLLKLEAKNLIELRKKIRMYMMGAIAGGSLQILRVKRDLEEYLAKELLYRKILTREARVKDLGVPIVIPNATENDVVSATLAASSFSNAWASAQMADLSFNWDSYLRRIVATETARSFSDVVDESATSLNLVRQWNSVLDAKTCKICRSLDGDETLPGKEFKNGFEPGWVHVFCRCYSVLILK